MRNRRGRGERGATLVESALITPVLLLFVFGIFEFGFAFRDYLAVSNIVRDAAREASVAGNAADSDYRVLRAVDRASAALPDGAIDRLVIFEASGPESTPHPDCLSGSNGRSTGSDRCNVYFPSDFALPSTEFLCDPSVPIPDPDRFYCPTGRDVVVGNLDYVGIWVQVTHEYITGLFGNQVVFTDQIILKLEPQDV
ncbi:MAG: TadE family protein [Actinomycetota bacterium]